jgi:signal transduction histidine kinase
MINEKQKKELRKKLSSAESRLLRVIEDVRGIIRRLDKGEYDE